MCCVILKLNQLQHFIDDTEASPVEDVLIFAQPRLTQLYKRVGELHQDTLFLKQKYK